MSPQTKEVGLRIASATRANPSWMPSGAKIEMKTGTESASIHARGRPRRPSSALKRHMYDSNGMLIKQWANAKEEGGGVAEKQSVLHIR